MLNDKTMIFVDGENLWFRYQELKKMGRVPREDTIEIGNCFVWNHRILDDDLWDIVRISYYTSMVGDDDAIKQARKKISDVTWRVNKSRNPVFNGGEQTDLEVISSKTGQIVPRVRKKSSKSLKESICDIQIAVDVMRSCYRDHSDVIYIFSGDGDFIDLFQEAIHSGKCVYAAAFSSGLNDDIRYSVDEFRVLDDYFFEPSK